jgi:pimeloyl-ACP methyl ester carboxylesterase
MPAPGPTESPHPPPPALLLNEAFAGAELAMVAASWPLLDLAPSGDGHPVLLLPGLLTDDLFTAPLCAFLRSRGYAAEGWGQGRNFGHWSLLESVLLPKLDSLCQRHGRKASVVGPSMGGLFARALAARRPDQVRCVVTMSSAAGGPPRSNHVWPLYRAMTGQPAETLQFPAPPVPSTSVFSRLDGLNDWRTCLQPVGAQTENVEIVSSHHGMANHPASLYLVADRLSQPDGAWQHFQPPSWASVWYPARQAGA